MNLSNMTLNNSVYESVPALENETYLIRKLDSQKDLMDLLKVYSDKKAVSFFNSDNCHGDTFYYDTIEKMKKAVDFWDMSYVKKYFVRYSIIDKTQDEVIGTIELFHRDAQDYYTDCGLLRLDLRSDYERTSCITAILGLLLPITYRLFSCSMIATKAMPEDDERVTALKILHFVESHDPLIGADGTEYGGYYVLHGKEDHNYGI